MDLVEQFIARYAKEYDFYAEAARQAADIIDTDLQTAGVRAIVTSRAKSIVRLEQKCRQRERRDPYVDLDHIYHDIVDLAGVRVALYFPGEREQVEMSILRQFRQLDGKREFPDSSMATRHQRFPGYSAVHYRVQLREQDLAEAARRYAAARIEIQVASVLMHAWSEVEHDLVYKPLEGDLSSQEYAVLDQLNGLVHAGEIALEQLQQAAERRVAEGSRRFANHYDLAAHLLSRMANIGSESVSEGGLGRVDVLFDLLRRLQLDTPDALAPYLVTLHRDVEIQSLAEQIADQVLGDDPSRYETYREVRAETPIASIAPDQSSPMEQQVGIFMSRWIELERLLRDIDDGGTAAELGLPSLRIRSINQVIADHNLLDADMSETLGSLRRLRNQLVHGIEEPRPEELARASRFLEYILKQISSNRHSTDDDSK